MSEKAGKLKKCSVEQTDNKRDNQVSKHSRRQASKHSCLRAYRNMERETQASEQASNCTRIHGMIDLTQYKASADESKSSRVLWPFMLCVLTVDAGEYGFVIDHGCAADADEFRAIAT